VKFLIAGLGNIGSEYATTRHNIGFMILDAFAEASNFSFKADRLASVAQVKHRGRILVLIKPSTYMNLSGKAVNYWLQQEKISKENLLIITDDIALPFGTIRIRAKGGDGGHNGLTSIIETLGTQDFARVRFGIGSDFAKGYQSEYVLGEWSDEQKKFLPERINKSIEIIKSFAAIGLQNTMNLYNNK
jgi:peptidyl-tRNA hydrolase, PTH1 family